MNYSTLPLCEIFALDEAFAAQCGGDCRVGAVRFNIPWMNGRADSFTAKLMKGDISGVERDWGHFWDHALGSRAWESGLLGSGAKVPTMHLLTILSGCPLVFLRTSPTVWHMTLIAPLFHVWVIERVLWALRAPASPVIGCVADGESTGSDHDVGEP